MTVVLSLLSTYFSLSTWLTITITRILYGELFFVFPLHIYLAVALAALRCYHEMKEFERICCWYFSLCALQKMGM